MPVYPMRPFIEYFRQVRRDIRPETYCMSLDVIKIARRAYKQGGFSQVATDLESFVKDNKVALISRSIANNCDNWRWAFGDLEMVTEMARDYSRRYEK